jgi:tetratricopeptide (TPR) repeat protein
MITKRIVVKNLMRRAMHWMPLLAALTLALAVFTIPAAAQGSKLADGPPPPEGVAAPASSASPDAAATPASPSGNSSDNSSDSATDAASGAASGRAPGPGFVPAPANEPEPVIPPAPTWDPLHATKSVEVGTFYLKKGDYDAAIDRFQEAARLQPGLAKPFLLLGEAYEKKGDPGSAVTAYRTYLKLYRTAPDRSRILERIAHLESKSKHDAAPPGTG